MDARATMLLDDVLAKRCTAIAARRAMGWAPPVPTPLEVVRKAIARLSAEELAELRAELKS